MNIREALVMIECQIEDDYDFAPELREAAASISAAVEQEPLLYRALLQLEQASTDFVLSILPLLVSLPKETFEKLIPALAAARVLLEKEDGDEVSNDCG